MYKYLLLIATLFFTIDSLAQNLNDSIEIRKPLGTVYYQHGKRITHRQIVQITRKNEAAYVEMKIARNYYTFGNIFGAAGGFLVGWPLGAAIAGGDPDWSLAAIGGGLIIVSIPFSISYSTHTKKAVALYNNGLGQSSSYNFKLSPKFSANSFGIIMTF